MFNKLIFELTRSFLLFVSVILIITGLGYLFSIEFIKKINKALSVIIFQDDLTFNFRIFTGTIFIITGLLILYFVYAKFLLIIF